jgi:hypothetical protein
MHATYVGSRLTGPAQFLLFTICALLTPFSLAIGGETTFRSPSQNTIAICADDQKYTEYIRLINRSVFSGRYNIVVLQDEYFSDDGTYFAYFGAPELSAECLAPQPQMAAFLNYIVDFAPRYTEVYIPGEGHMVFPIDATSYETPTHSTKKGDDIGVYICYRNADPCRKDLVMSLFGISDDYCRSNACWER